MTDQAKSGAERQRAYRQRKAEKRQAVAQAAADLVPTQPALFEPKAAETVDPGKAGQGARWREYAFRRFGSPLVARMKMASMSVEDLAAYLRCDRLTAFRLIGEALDATIPFLHAKAPADPGEVQVPQLQVVVATRLAAAMDAEDGVTIALSGTGLARDDQ